MIATSPNGRHAKEWERSARRLRQRQNLSPTDKLDPWSLAHDVGLHVLDGEEALDAINRLPIGQRTHILNPRSGSWSGGVLPQPLPDSRLLCILNPTHHIHRRKITLMEEVAHIHLGHQPTGLTKISTGLRSRSFNSELEKEAYGVGAAALLPWEPFCELITAGLTTAQIAGRYAVSEPLVIYRTKVTGLWSLYNSARTKSA
jgi:hypothetical protein